MDAWEGSGEEQTPEELSSGIETIPPPGNAIWRNGEWPG
jgi:hypothetical protein